MELVSVVVSRHDVQEKDVLGFVVEARDTEFHLWEHLPGEEEKKRKNEGVIDFCFRQQQLSRGDDKCWRYKMLGHFFC